MRSVTARTWVPHYIAAALLAPTLIAPIRTWHHHPKQACQGACGDLAHRLQNRNLTQVWPLGHAHQRHGESCPICATAWAIPAVDAVAPTSPPSLDAAFIVASSVRSRGAHTRPRLAGRPRDPPRCSAR